ncbi:HAD-IA family hydrolase [Pseudoclostridium thermosuccinogenes]|uniref:HAD family hydrolase n=1 Tax=Clostridium thermosuccinogenes TaxID=84032 RepID=UPI0013747E17|nr:HAD-IA family hydrolase [Pseudoclostridium thermosuccinogenes]
MHKNQKPYINVLIFDFDGVIIDSRDDIAGAVEYSLKHFGRPPLPRDEIISYIGWGADNLIRSCFKGCDDEVIREAISFYKKYYLDNSVKETKLYKNVEETLDFFKGKKIALVTNKPEDISLSILDKLGVADRFNIVIGPESLKKLKPDPEGILKVLDAFGEDPKKTIMIGDTYTDVEAGKAAGTYTCGVTYGIGSTEDLLKASPDYIVDDIIKLTDIII